MTWDEIGDIMNRHPDTCRKSMTNRIQKSKMPPKERQNKRIFTSDVSRILQSIIREFPQYSLSSIRFELAKRMPEGRKVPSKTGIWKVLRQKGIISTKLQVGPLLSYKHRIERIKFAKKMLNVRYLLTLGSRIQHPQHFVYG
jgi:Transposase